MSSLPGPAADPVSGLYVHVPFCDGKCRYCAFYSVAFDAARAARFVRAVGRELALALGSAGPLRIDTVYLGGGTPTLLGPELAGELCAAVRTAFGPGGAAAEWTVECNPGSPDPLLFGRLLDAGVNRISIGAQSFDDGVLRQLGRRHRADDVGRTVRLARTAGFRNLGLDVIACVPGVTAAAWRATLDAACALEPEHLSVYALTVEEGSWLAREAGAGGFRALEPEEELERLDEAETLLASAGYARYEISNYARPGRECRHNVACWRGERYLGLGPAAASHVGMDRWTNRADVDAYLSALELHAPPPREVETLSPEQKAGEMLAFGMRLAEGVDPVSVASRTGLGGERLARWDAVFTRLGHDGLVERAGACWRLTARGRHFADHVGAELLSA